MSCIEISMNQRRAGGRLLAALLILFALMAPAYAQDEPTLVRGTINFARDGGMIGLVMEVTTDQQQTVHIYLERAFKVIRIEPASLDGIAIGERVAVSPLDGQAGVVWHLTGGDLAENQVPWRLPDGVELVAGEVTARADNTFTISTSAGESTAEIGADTAIVASVEESSTMSWLHEGLPVVVMAEIGQDGTLSTNRIYVSQSAQLPL